MRWALIPEHSKANIQDHIRRIVVAAQGIKGVELSARLATEYMEVSGTDMLQLIFEMIQNGELVEVEYELPTMSYRTKSFILPKGTSVNVSKR